MTLREEVAKIIRDGVLGERQRTFLQMADDILEMARNDPLATPSQEERDDR